MSVFDIMDYVRTTPGNTNPAVVRSMVESEIRTAKKEASSEILKLKQDGGVGYTEVVKTEILAPTPCQLSDYNYETSGYVCPYSPESFYDNLSPTERFNYNHYLYVDGKEFEYDYDPRLGSGWIGTDRTDDRFSSLYEFITPFNIDPAPDTVMMQVVQVHKIIHSINEEYMPDDFQLLPQRVSLIEKDGVLVEKAEYTYGESGIIIFNIPKVNRILTVGTRFTVHYDGTDYDCMIMPSNDPDYVYFGNSSLIMWGGNDTGEPFAGAVFLDPTQGDYIEIVTSSESDTTKKHTIGITLNSMSNSSQQLSEGGYGYTESNTLAFDGVLTEEIIESSCVKFSNDPFDLSDVTKIIVNIHPTLAEAAGFDSFEFTPEYWKIVADQGVEYIVFDETTPVLARVTTPVEGSPFLDRGIYGYVDIGSDESGNNVAYMWPSRVEWGENVHKIDPKYLPKGVGCIGQGVIDFSGDPTGMTIIDSEGEKYVKLSDDLIDLNTIARLIAKIHPIVAESEGLNTTLNFGPKDWVIHESEFVQVLGLNILGGLLTIIVSKIDNRDVSPGTYALFRGEEEDGVMVPYMWISRIEYDGAIHPIDPKCLPKNGVGYTEGGIVYQSEELTLTWNGVESGYSDGNYYSISIDPGSFSLVKGKKYKVNWNGNEYDCVAYVNVLGEGTYIGSWDFVDSDGTYDEEPFFIETWVDNERNARMYVCSTDEKATFSISNEIVHSIDTKYIAKTINLDKYGIGKVILDLIAAGGGTQKIESYMMDKFWSEFSTESMIRLVMNYVNDSILQFDNCVKIFKDNETAFVSFSSTMPDETASLINIVNVGIVHSQNHDTGTPAVSIFVKVS